MTSHRIAAARHQARRECQSPRPPGHEIRHDPVDTYQAQQQRHAGKHHEEARRRGRRRHRVEHDRPHGPDLGDRRLGIQPGGDPPDRGIHLRPVRNRPDGDRHMRRHASVFHRRLRAPRHIDGAFDPFRRAPLEIVRPDVGHHADDGAPLRFTHESNAPSQRRVYSPEAPCGLGRDHGDRRVAGEVRLGEARALDQRNPHHAWIAGGNDVQPHQRGRFRWWRNVALDLDRALRNPAAERRGVYECRAGHAGNSLQPGDHRAIKGETAIDIRAERSFGVMRGGDHLDSAEPVDVGQGPRAAEQQPRRR